MLSVILLCVLGGGLLLWCTFHLGKLYGWHEGWDEAWNLIHDWENSRLEKKSQKDKTK